MQYTEITIYTSTPAIDIVAGFLTMRGVRGVMIEDASDFNRFLEDTSVHWDYVDEDLMRLRETETNVKFYLPDNPQGAEMFREIRSALPKLRRENPQVEMGRLEVETSRVDEEDWSTAWKKYYHPLKVGERLVVVPQWEQYSPAPGETVLTLDPGMAFGTGTHETTRLCLRLLEQTVTPGCSLLDVGTGSGILAIAGLLLGAGQAVGVDIDQLAAKIAGENAALNGVADRLTLFHGDLTEKILGNPEVPQTYEVICANIVADVIIRLSKEVTRFMKPAGPDGPGSVLLCSGIIDERCEEVKAALEAAGLTVEQTLTENGWVALRAAPAGNFAPKFE